MRTQTCEGCAPRPDGKHAFLADGLAVGQQYPCLDAADTNDDNLLNIADCNAFLGLLFGTLGALPEPFSACPADAQPPQRVKERPED